MTNIKNSAISNKMIAYDLDDDTLMEFSDGLLFSRDNYAGYCKTSESCNAKKISVSRELKASGTVTINDSTIDTNAGILGFAKVNISNCTIIANNIDIVGGVNYKYTTTQTSKGYTHTESRKSSSTLTIYNTDLSGKIDGFGTVKLSSVNFTGSIKGVKSSSYDSKKDEISDTLNGTLSISIDSKSVGEDWVTYRVNSNDGVYGDVISGFLNVSMSGLFDVKKFKFASLHVKGNIIGGCDGVALGKITLKNDTYVVGNVIGFKTVSLNLAQIDGDIGSMDFHGDSVVFDDVTFNGNIINYKTVKISVANVNGDINGFGSGSSVTLGDHGDISGIIDNVQKLTVNKGECEIGSYHGTMGNDVVTIKKGALVVFTQGGLDFSGGEKDKLVVDGTMILNDSLYGVESVSGKGSIVTNSSNYDNIKEALAGSKVKVYDLGDNCLNFQGASEEKSDNSKKKAADADWDAVFDGMGGYKLDGWLGKDVDIEDTVDWFEFSTSEYGSVSRLTFEGLGSNDTVTINGEEIDHMAGYDLDSYTKYIVSITRNEQGSISYCARMY